MRFLSTSRKDTAAITRGLALDRTRGRVSYGVVPAISSGFCSLGKPNGSGAVFRVHTRSASCYYGGAVMIIIMEHKVRKLPWSFAIPDNTNTFGSRWEVSFGDDRFSMAVEPEWPQNFPIRVQVSRIESIDRHGFVWLARHKFSLGHDLRTERYLLFHPPSPFYFFPVFLFSSCSSFLLLLHARTRDRISSMHYHLDMGAVVLIPIKLFVSDTNLAAGRLPYDHDDSRVFLSAFFFSRFFFPLLLPMPCSIRLFRTKFKRLNLTYKWMPGWFLSSQHATTNFTSVPSSTEFYPPGSMSTNPRVDLAARSGPPLTSTLRSIHSPCMTYPPTKSCFFVKREPIETIAVSTGLGVHVRFCDFRSLYMWGDNVSSWVSAVERSSNVLWLVNEDLVIARWSNIFALGMR